MVVLTLRLQRYQLHPGRTRVLQMAADLLEQKGLNLPQPSPFLLPAGCEFPYQRPSSLLTLHLTHQVWGMAEKKWQCCGRRKGDEQNFLSRPNLLRRQADVSPTGCVIESWGKKCAGINSLSGVTLTPKPLSLLKNRTSNILQLFSFLLFSIFLPGSSRHRSHLCALEVTLARELTLTGDREAAPLLL